MCVWRGGAHVTDSTKTSAAQPGQSCCSVPPLCLHFGVKTTPTVAPGPQHSISLATINIRDRFFLTFLLSQVQYINTSKSIFVEIQKYYGQLSRWFYAKLLQNIKALEGKQTLRRHYMLLIGCFERRPPASLRLQSRQL